ncbi:MAG: hypothetical protein K2W95_18760 [Candidatus Obscuribacterales bacterium]|nr:hypothetical protein [Candidatus Obscuribacterales bacterium]
MLVDVGRIKSSELCPGFVLADKGSSTYGANWYRRYDRPSPSGESISISIGSSGMQHYAQELKCLRDTFKEPQVVFDKQASINHPLLINELCVLLGRPGENQVWAEVNELPVYTFELEKMFSTTVSTRIVLRVQGWVRVSRAIQSDRVVDRYYDGIFYDTASDGDAEVEFLNLQCETLETMERLRPEFEKMLDSVTWK